MTGRDLIKDILNCEDIDKELLVSIYDEGSNRRVTSDSYYCLENIKANADKIVLSFGGAIND